MVRKMAYDADEDLYVITCSDGTKYTSKDFANWFDKDGRRPDFGLCILPETKQEKP
jgi:hypothetical protein